MTKKMRITQIGGGSTYSPDFADILIRRKQDFPVDEWVMMDVDRSRCEIVARVCQKMLEGAGVNIKVIVSDDLLSAVQDANFVFTTIRVGGSQCRILDESIPPKHGLLLGQETTAPGGMMMGLRNIPAILEIADAVKEKAHPNAWLINLSNPSGMLVEALNRHSDIKFAGLCNGPTVMVEAMSRVFNVENPKDIFCKIIGLNHLIWMKVFLKGEDVTQEAMQRLDCWYAENLPPMREESPNLEIQDFIGWIPVGPYLRFYYELPEAVEDLAHSKERWPTMLGYIRQRLGALLDGIDVSELPTRAHLVRALEQKTLELYEKEDLAGYELTRNSRGGRGYAEAGLSLASAIWNDKYEVHHPDVPHRGTIHGLEEYAVATTTSMVNKAGIFPMVVEELPPHALAFVRSAKTYEKLTIDAAINGNYHAALEALMANPLVVSYNQAKAALNDLLIQQKQYLPNFAETIARLEKK